MAACKTSAPTAMTRSSTAASRLPARPASQTRGAWVWVAVTSAAAGLPLLGGASAWGWAAWLAVTGLAGWPLRRAMATAAPGVADSGPGPSAPTRAGRTDGQPLALAVLPVWQQHVGTARTQLDDAVSELVRSFSSISEQFEAAGFKGADGSMAGDADPNLLAVCEKDLGQIIDVMNQIAARRDATAAGLQELNRATGELRDMAQDVARIAAQTNLLAINAAIEAAHAGDLGRGFGIVAKEIRSLSQLSAETASRITDRIGRVTSLMTETSEAGARAATDDKSAIEASNNGVAEVLSHMRQLNADGQMMRERGQVIRTDVERLIVSLQFQDRVNQVISVIEDDMARLHDALARSEAVPAPAQWLDELQQRYTMREQRQRHAAQAAPAAASAPAAPGRKVVFF